MLPAAHAIANEVPRATLRVYVDDAKVAAKGRGAAAVLGTAARVWKREVEAFGGELSLTKSVATVICSVWSFV